MNHEKHRFVEKVNYITSPGHGDGKNWREKVGLTGGGPAAVISTMGIFDFSDEGRMKPRSLHPGFRASEVRDATGFELDIPEAVRETDPPRPDELKVIREYDPLGFWTGWNDRKASR